MVSRRQLHEFEFKCMSCLGFISQQLPVPACTHWFITIQFLGAADHRVCVSVCVTDEVDPILLAEHGSFRSEKGWNIKPVNPLMNHNEHAAEFAF